MAHLTDPGAKVKAGAKPKAKAAPLSGPVLAGKTIAEKITLARLVLRLMYTFLRCIFCPGSGAEVKKELTALNSLLLDVGEYGDGRFSEGTTALNRHVQTLKGVFSRRASYLVCYL